MSTEVEVEGEVPWLSAGEQAEWRALMALLMTLMPALDAQLKRDAGVNVFEYQVLAGISEAHDCAMGLSELAALSRGSLSRLSHAVTRLEKAGWVERRTFVDRGGRRTEARLTEAGMAKIEEIAPGHVREARRLVLDVLTPEELATLGTAARKITAAIGAAAAEPCTEPPPSC